MYTWRLGCQSCLFLLLVRCQVKLVGGGKEKEKFCLFSESAFDVAFFLLHLLFTSYSNRRLINNSISYFLRKSFDFHNCYARYRYAPAYSNIFLFIIVFLDKRLHV